uniref:NADP-dependent oxidoreductase domain-containing protein n=1 Tax=Neogobius melanostomus TaxID=47308 RepID=A0A8C6TU74_9GOBI
MSTLSVKLNNGADMPIVGLGTWRVSGYKLSYRHHDGAYVYQNGDEVGAGIHAMIEQGKVKREELFIVSKLWNTFHLPSLVRKACEKTHSDLKLDYVDLRCRIPPPTVYCPTTTYCPNKDI